MSGQKRGRAHSPSTVCSVVLGFAWLTLTGCDLNPRPEDTSAKGGANPDVASGSGGRTGTPVESMDPRTPPPLTGVIDQGGQPPPDGGGPVFGSDGGPPPPPPPPDSLDAGADAPGDAGADGDGAPPDTSRVVNRTGE